MLKRTPFENKIESIISPVAEEMGLEIVQLTLRGGSQPVLDILADKAHEGRITMDECGKLSQAISVVLDVENIMGEKRYMLDVGSPGINRPLTKLKDFERFSGKTAKIELEEPINEQKRFKGVIKSVIKDDIIFEIDGTDFTIPFSQIERAKLLILEEIVETKPQQQKQNKKSKGKK